MTITPIPVDDFPRTGRPWNNITPFTYRDGLTYLEVLEALRAYVRDTLVPQINAEMEEFGEAWEQEVIALVAAVNAALEAQATEVTAELEAAIDAINARADLWLSTTLENNDTINEALISTDSLTRAAVFKVIPHTSIIEYGAVGDGIADDTAAMIAAANSGTRVAFPMGTYKQTATISLSSETEFIGAGSRGATVIYAETSVTGYQVDVFNKADSRIEGITFDGGIGRGTGASAIRIVGGTDNTVYNCRFENQPAPAILARDAAKRVTIESSHFAPNTYGAQIFFLTAVQDSQILNNHFEDSAGFCISLHGGCLRNSIIGNSCDDSYGELIGITYDCNYGIVANNRAFNTDDNGISVTGQHWTVTGNLCEHNAGSGICIYGSRNTVTGNVCRNNNVSIPSGGIRLQPAFGGLAARNVVTGNTSVTHGAGGGVQDSGIRIDGLSYTQWASGQTIPATSTYRYYGLNLYMAVGNGLTGSTPPTHNNGDASDGNIMWRYVDTTFSATPFIANYNDVRNNALFGNTIRGVRGGASVADNKTDDIGVDLLRYTVATLPSQRQGRFIFVTDATGGQIPAFSDGVDWRRVDDRTVIA